MPTVSHKSQSIVLNNFKKSVFTKTYLEDVNLSNCEIDGIEIGIPELYKVKVNASQGLELVKLIGLIVE